MNKSITNILQTQIFEGTQLKTKTDYSGAYVYVNNVLIYTNIQGGRIVSPQTEGTNNNNVFQYNLTDHLGNVRVTFEKGADGKAEIIQEDHYYPFGMRMSGQHYDNKSLINKYLYNGKEQQEQTGMYDYGFRQMDAQLGRWHVVDALAENYFSESPYSYVNNNPINQYDILGLLSSSNLTNIGFRADVWAMIQWAWDVTPEESSFGSYSGAQAMQGASLDGGFGTMSKAKYGKFWGTSFGKFLQRLGGWETDFSGIGKNGEKYQWYTNDNTYAESEWVSDNDDNDSGKELAFKGLYTKGYKWTNNSAGKGDGDSDGVWGIMSINVNLYGEEDLTAGHAWIRLEKENGKIATMSLWGNKGEQELWYNLEKKWGYGEVYKSTIITKKQFKQIGRFNASHNNWTSGYTCAGYSAELWNLLTGENLSANDILWFTTPRALLESINNNP